MKKDKDSIGKTYRRFNIYTLLSLCEDAQVMDKSDGVFKTIDNKYHKIEIKYIPTYNRCFHITLNGVYHNSYESKGDVWDGLSKAMPKGTYLASSSKGSLRS